MKIANRSRIFIYISLAIMVVALVMTLTGNGINYGIDFTGGLNMEYKMNSTFDHADIEAALKEQNITDYKIATSGQNGDVLQLRIAHLSDESEIQTLQTKLQETLLATYPEMDVTNVTTAYVGPVAGAALIRNAILSVVIASLLMLVYIAIRFDFSSGIAAVIGLLHDVLVMVSFMVILRNFVQLNSSFIAALLTIVGYSINNTIVIFDRIRENNRKLSGRSGDEIVNISVKESLGRTINTTLTTLITIITLYVVGVDAIREFSLPIIVGILAGAYSANLINGYVWSALNTCLSNMKKNSKLKAKKA